MRSAFCGILMLSFACLLISGCYSVPADSDIPWNAPQTWEGSPSIPGFSAD